MTQMTQDPQTPREDDGGYMQYLMERCDHIEGELRVVTTQHQIARDVATDMSLKRTAVEGALREAEAKAARYETALKEIGALPFGTLPRKHRQIANDALRQPKAAR